MDDQKTMTSKPYPSENQWILSDLCDGSSPSHRRTTARQQKIIRTSTNEVSDELTTKQGT